MVSIIRAKPDDNELLCSIGKKTFIESHGPSASEKDIFEYLENNYTPDIFKKQLSDNLNIFNIIYYKEQPAGYSKIRFNESHKEIELLNITKMERLYLLKDFYNLKLGYNLFQFNLNLALQNEQKGMWLFVWKDNKRAVDFYKKAGFEIIGDHDFKLTESHKNPNYLMLLDF